MMLLDGGGRLVQHLLVEDVVADRLPSRMLTMFSTAATLVRRLPPGGAPATCGAPMKFGTAKHRARHRAIRSAFNAW
jgi:hypothetical protein